MTTVSKLFSKGTTCLLSTAMLFCISCRFSRPNYDPGFDRIDVVAQTDPQDQYALSPDGKVVAHLGTGIWPTRHFDGKTLQFFSVNPAREVASIQLSTDPSHGPALGPRDRLQFCDHGKYLLAFEDPQNVMVVDAQVFKLHTTISLHESEEAIRAELIKKPHGDLLGAGDLLFAACAANSPLAAFYVGKLEPGLGHIKVFAIDSGLEIPGFDSLTNPTEPAGLAVSSSGSSIAFVNQEALPSTVAHPIAGVRRGGMDDGTVTVIDTANHQVVRQFYVAKETLLDEDPIAFAGDHILAVELNIFKPYRPERPLVGIDNIERSIHFFDAATGSETGTIGAPELNSFRLRGITADGQTVLTLDETWRYCIFCSRFNDERIGTVAQFVLWNRNTGRPIQQSPPLALVHHACPWLQIMGSCTPSDEVPDVTLDQSGNAIIASWSSGGQPLSVYTLRPYERSENRETTR